MDSDIEAPVPLRSGRSSTGSDVVVPLVLQDAADDGDATPLWVPPPPPAVDYGAIEDAAAEAVEARRKTRQQLRGADDDDDDEMVKLLDDSDGNDDDDDASSVAEGVPVGVVENDTESIATTLYHQKLQVYTELYDKIHAADRTEPAYPPVPLPDEDDGEDLDQHERECTLPPPPPPPVIDYDAVAAAEAARRVVSDEDSDCTSDDDDDHDDDVAADPRNKMKKAEEKRKKKEEKKKKKKISSKVVTVLSPMDARQWLEEDGLVLPEAVSDGDGKAHDPAGGVANELLQTALRMRHTTRVTLLLQSFLVDVSLFGRALCDAIRMGTEGPTHILLDAGVSPNIQDTREMPLGVPATYIEDAPGFTPLLVASKYGREDLVELLLARGAEVDATDALMKTPLIHAVEHGHDRVCEMLLNAGADVNAMDTEMRTPLIWSVMNYTYPGNTVYLLLSTPGVRIDCKSRNDWTPLCYAASAGRGPLCQLLIDHGADPRATKDTVTPVLNRATRHTGDASHAAVRQLLKAHGGAEEKGSTCVVM